jgi:hypothetical protein
LAFASFFNSDVPQQIAPVLLSASNIFLLNLALSCVIVFMQISVVNSMKFSNELAMSNSFFDEITLLVEVRIAMHVSHMPHVLYWV